MRKLLLAGTAAFALAGIAFSGAANAQSCVWNGYNWACPQPYYAPGYHDQNVYAPSYPYYSEPAYNPGWGRPYPGPKAGG